MPLTQEIIDRFFANGADPQISGEAVPHTSSGNRVEALIDGENYFADLSNEIVALQSAGDARFFYFANWWAGLAEMPAVVGSAGPFISAWMQTSSGQPFSPLILGQGCAAPQTNATLLDQLADLSTIHNVDVRALIWMSPVIMNEFVGSLLPGSNAAGEMFWTGRAHSLRSAQHLRTRIGAAKVVLNTLGHPIGAWHVKMVLCGDSNSVRAYVGGMDLVCDKYSETTHPPNNHWHDAAIKVEGPAAVAIYEYFRQVWAEQRLRRVSRFMLNGSEFPSHSADTLEVNALPAAAANVAGVGTQQLQVLRTFPRNLPSQANPSTANLIENILLLTTRQEPLSFAPDGLFEFRLAVRKAISSAEKFIYIEDQAFGGREIMGWLNARLLQVPELKVIMLWGADPGDPKNVYIRLSMEALTNQLSISDIQNRIVFCEYKNVTVHSKLWVIDDVWATIGSANCARRSLYLDAEIGVGVLDDADPGFAQRLRKDLWAEHCDIRPGTPPSDELLDLDRALGIWNASWTVGTPLSGIVLKSGIEKKTIPFQYATPPGPGQWDTGFNSDLNPNLNPTLLDIGYDLADGDSR